MSESRPLSPIQMLDTALLELSFSLNPEMCDIEPADGNFTLGTQFATNLDKEDIVTCSCLFDVDFSLTPADNPDETILIVKCKYESTVGIPRESLSDEMPPEQLEKSLQTNAFSSGYACLRSSIDGIARQSKLGKFFLPAFDADEYMHLVFENQREAAK